MANRQSDKGKINTIIVHENPAIRNVLEGMVDRNSMLHLGGSYASIDDPSITSPEHPSNQVWLMDVGNDPYAATIHDKITIARMLKEKNPDTNIIGISQKGANEHTLSKVIKSKAYEDVMSITPEMRTIELLEAERGLRENIEHCIQEGRLYQRMKVGIIGMGDIGSNIARNILEKKWLAGLYWYTQNDKDLAFDTLVEGAYYGDDVQRMSSIDDLLSPELNLDVLVVARGHRRGDYTQAPDRGKVAWEDFPHTLALNMPVLKSMEKTGFGYRAPTLFMPNPPGVLQWVAHNCYGIPADRITSVACDSTRLKRFILKDIIMRNPSLKEAVSLDDVHVPLSGEHGPGIIPLWNDAIVHGEERLDRFLMREGIKLSADEYDAFRIRAIKYGEINKQKAKASGINSFDVAQSVERGLDMVAHYRQTSETMWYTQFDDAIMRALYPDTSAAPVSNPFLISPARIEYAGMYGKANIAFKRGGTFNTEYVRNLPEETKERFKEVISEQARYVGRASEIVNASARKAG